MPKTLLIIGHSGFIGKNFLKFLNKEYKNTNIIGISKDQIKKSNYPNLNIHQHKSLHSFYEQMKFDFVFFLAHGQNSDRPSESELRLEKDFVNLITHNGITCPIITILSAGKGSTHLNSRVTFNENLKSRLDNRIIEIKTSIIASPGSISYEIPYRSIKKLSFVPKFPWYHNKVSLTKIENILEVFDLILKGDNSDLYFPKHITTTYGEYLNLIAKEQNKRIIFIPIPFNERHITPIFLSFITGLPYYLVHNLFGSLSFNSVIKENH